MLREASALLDAELVWKYWPRHERWQRPPLSWRWTLPPVLRLEASSVALVSVAGCGCGRYAGVRWIVAPMDGARVWSCERCAHAVEVHHVTFENADQIDCDGNCQRVPG